MLKSLFRPALGLFCCYAIIAFPAGAQEVTGNIVGRITDATGSTVSSATVTVKHTAQNATLRTLKTDTSGDYAATFLPVGSYEVAVEAPGFKKATITGIELTANQKYTADF